MRPARPAFELGVELAGQEERMVDALYYLYQVIVGIDAGGPYAPRFELVTVDIVAFAAMAVALDDPGLPI